MKVEKSEDMEDKRRKEGKGEDMRGEERRGKILKIMIVNYRKNERENN